jgi:ParB family transcriptional regulator, chromosome partitioning protein
MALERATTTSYHHIQDVELSKIRESTQFVRSNLGDISGLANSISVHGLVAPLVIRKSNRALDSKSKEFEIVSGYRRLNALKQIGIDHAPCKVVDSSDKETFELSLVENLQRKSLDPIEEALSFQYYIRICKWGHAKNLAKKLGKSEEYINHRLKLLELPEAVLKMIGTELTTSQAEELSWLEDPETQTRLARLVVENELTVKQLHELAMLEKSKRRAGVDFGASFSDEGRIDSTDWLPDPSLTRARKPAQKNILEDNVTALRLTLSFMDNSIGAFEALGISDQLLDFMIEQRYTLHQVLDSFIKKISHLEHPQA